MAHRPKIPKHLVDQMEAEPDKYNLDHLYEIGGYNSKGEFVRDAVRSKVESIKTNHGIDVE